jgi:hypothetical protein
MNLNALQQAKNFILGGLQKVAEATPPGMAIKAAQQVASSPQVQSYVQPKVNNFTNYLNQEWSKVAAPMVSNIQAAPQTFQQNWNTMVQPKINSVVAPFQNPYNTVTLDAPGKFLTKIENRPDIASQIFLKPIAGAAKTLGAALIQAPTLAVTGGKVNPEFWNESELAKHAGGDTFGQRALASGKEYLRTVPEAGLELYSLGGGAALKGGAKAVLQQAGRGLLNIGLGSMVSDGSKIIENIIHGKPLAEGLKESTIEGAKASYYMPVFNAVTDTLASRIIPNLASKVASVAGSGKIGTAAKWTAEQLPKLTDENLAQYGDKAWDFVRDTSLSWSVRRPVLFKILGKEIARGILEAPAQGTGFGILDYVKGNAPLLESLSANIASSLIMNPVFRVGSGLAGSGIKQVWYGPTGELNPAAGKGLQRSIAMGMRKFVGDLDHYFSTPHNQAGYIDFGAEIGPQATSMNDSELGRLNIVQKLQKAYDDNNPAMIKMLTKKLDQLDEAIKAKNAPVAQEPVQPEAVQPATTPQTDLLGNVVPEQSASIKPEQQSMIPDIGAGKASPEEIKLAMDRMAAEKKGTAGIEGTPLGNQIDQTTTQEQMGPGMFDEGTAKATSAVHQQIDNLEKSLSKVLPEEDMYKMQQDLFNKGLSEVDYMNELRRIAAEKGMKLPAVSPEINQVHVEDVSNKPKAEWTEEDYKAVSRFLDGAPIDELKRLDEKSLKDVLNLGTAPKNTFTQDQELINNLEDQIRGAYMSSDEASAGMYMRARDQAVKAAREAGIDVTVSPIEQLRGDGEAAAQQVLGDYKKEISNSGDLLGGSAEVNQYQKVIQKAVRLWNLHKNKSGVDMDWVERRTPGLDEALDPIRNLLGREPTMQDLHDIQFPKTASQMEKGARVKTENKTMGQPFYPKGSPDSTAPTIPELPAGQEAPQIAGATEPKQLYPGALPGAEKTAGATPSKTPPETKPPANGEEAVAAMKDMFKQAEAAKKEANKTTPKKIFAKFKEQYLNAFSGLWDAVHSYEKATGKKLAIINNPAAQAEMTWGGSMAKIFEGTVQREYIPIIEDARKQGVIDDLGVFLDFNRFMRNVKIESGKAEQLLRSNDITERAIGAKMMERINNNQINPLGISKEVAQEGIDTMKVKLGAEKYAQMEALAQRIWAFNDNMLNLIGKPQSEGGYGLITPEIYQKLKSYGLDYVPELVIDVLSDVGESGLRAQKGPFDVDFQKAVMRFKGTTKNVEDPLITSLRKAIYTMSLGERNNVTSTYYNFRKMAKGEAEPFDAQPTMVPVGKVVHKAEIDPKSMSIIEQIAKSLGTSFETKLRAGGKRLGYYSPSEDAIVRRFGTSTLTATHELGHAIDEKYGLKDLYINGPKETARGIRIIMSMFKDSLPAEKKAKYTEALNLYNTVQKELRNLADLREVRKAYGRKAEEKMATLFAWAVNNPGETERVAPNAFKIFNRFLDANPELAKIKQLKPASLVQGMETATEILFGKGGEPKAPEGYVTLSFIDNGKVKYFYAPEAEGNMLKNINQEMSKGMQGAVGWLFRGGAKMLREGATTLSATFTFANLLRDQKRFLAMSKFGFSDPKMVVTYPMGLLRGFIAAIRGVDDPLMFEFLNSRAAGSTLQRNLTPEAFIEATRPKTKAEQIRQKINIIGQAAKALRQFNNIFEETTKLTAFRQGMRKYGYKPGDNIPPDILNEIAYEVRNYGGSPDFSKFGTRGRELNSLFMFFNARLQGTVGDLQRIQDPAVAFRNLLMTTAPAIALYAWNQAVAPNARDETPDYKKDNYFNIYTGRQRFNPDTGKLEYEAITLPKSDADKIFGGTTESLLDFYRHRDPKFLAQILQNVTGSISPFSSSGDLTLSPVSVAAGMATSLNPALGLPLEMLSNYDFFRQRPIISDKLSKLTPRAQSYASTSSFAKELGNFFGVAPAMVDHVVERLTGSAGTDVFKMIGVAMLGDKFKLETAPIIKRFYGWAGGAGDTDVTTALFNKTAQLGQAYNTYRDYMKKGQYDQADMILQQVPNVLAYNSIQNVVNHISEIRNNISAVQSNPSMSDEEKQSTIQDMYGSMMEMIKQVNDLVDVPTTPKIKTKLLNNNQVSAAENPQPETTISTGAKVTSTSPSTGKIKFKIHIPTKDEWIEQDETGKQPVSLPTIEKPTTGKMFMDQFDMINKTVDNIESKIESLRLDPTLDYATKQKYMDIYDQRKQDLMQQRYDYTQQNAEMWKDYLTSDEGVAWYKKEATAYYKSKGLKVPKEITNLGKATGGTSAKKIKVPKIKMGTIKSYKASTKKTKMPKISAPKKFAPLTFKISKSTAAAFKVPKLKIKSIKSSIKGFKNI